MIRVDKLNKFFGEKHAVSDVSFDVREGMVLGLLGPNGAGKSTTMRIVTGCLRPCSGRVFINGHDVWRSPRLAKSVLGFLPESAPSYGELSVREFVTYIASIRGMRGKECQVAVDRVIELCYLQGVEHQIVDTLSKGYRHRICLAQSLVHDPKVIIFDEPTDGLDPNQKGEIRNLIHEIRSDKAIILSTHILDEVEAVCTDVVLLNHGKIIETGTPSDFKEKAKSRRQLSFRGDTAEQTAVCESVKKIPEVLSVAFEAPASFILQTTAKSFDDREALASKIYQMARERDWNLTHLSFNRGTLEEVFRELTLNQEFRQGSKPTKDS